MKPLLFLAAASLIPLAACSSAKGPRAALECPATQGQLTRTSAATDGKACTYVSADGAEVVLRLLPVAGGPYATLDRLEGALLAEAGPASATPKTGEATSAEPSPQSAADARRAADEAAQDSAGVVVARDNADDGVDVHMKDGKVVVAEGGSTTRVNLPGIHIEADDNDDSASVRIGPMHIDANGDEAVIKVRRDVRLKGEALSREKRGIRATYIAEGKAVAEGARFVGYEAGGPKIGPLTVAVVRAKDEIRDGDDVYRDVKRLVRKNGGV